MAITFRRILTPGVTPGAQEFTRETESGRAALGCPVCGHVFELPPGFAPDQTGRVNYAVSCPTGVCDFWDWCELADHWLEPT
jgi:hypothetical protein